MKTKLALFLTLSMVLIASAFSGTAQAAPEPYSAYSLMNLRSAGQFFDTGGHLSGQWSWRTDSPEHYSISWDKDKPNDREYFLRSTDGNWLLLDGWSAHDTYYTQRVITESYGDVNCQNMKAFKLDGGRQHYTPWNVSTAGVCLDARGIITEQSSGKTFSFHHKQIWKPPQNCTNRYFPSTKSPHRCIRQWEMWEDDNDHEFKTTIKRENWLSKGQGMAFIIQKNYPDSWRADGGNYWKY